MNTADLLKKYSNIEDAITEFIAEVGKLSDGDISQMPDETMETLIKTAETIDKLLASSRTLGKNINKLCKK